MSAKVGRVLVTGASGFIACHVVQQLLRAGHQVRGTVRSLKDEAKLKPIRELAPDSAGQLELVEANLLDDECWDALVAGCTHVLHVASPFPLAQPEDENEVIRPAVQGTLSVLKACAKSGTVKRVVLTSSVAAVNGGPVPGRYNEADWPDVSDPAMTPYIKSKTLAERAAWDFMEKLPEEEKFQLVVTNPAAVLGPALTGNLSTVMAMVKAVLSNAVPVDPTTTLCIIDVRDVAAAHVRAMTKPDAAGKRIILSNQCLFYRDIAKIVHDEFAPQGYKVTIEFEKTGGEVSDYDNTRMKTLLDIKPIEARVTLLDMCYNLIEDGHVEKTPGYKGRKQDAKRCGGLKLCNTKCCHKK